MVNLFFLVFLISSMGASTVLGCFRVLFFRVAIFVVFQFLDFFAGVGGITKYLEANFACCSKNANERVTKASSLYPVWGKLCLKG